MLEKSRLLTCWSQMSLSYRGAAIVTIPALCLIATLGTWLWSRSEALEIRPVSSHGGKIEIFVRLDADKLKFIIRDDGPGIELKHHQRVFRLFETIKPRDLQENTGIGLAIAKKLVERVGGQIWLENPDSGNGLSVYFTWPQFPAL